MRIKNISIKLVGVLIALGVSLVVATLWATTRTNASSAGGTTTFGTFTWGVTQRGRLIVTAPSSGQWSSGRAGEVVLGFDVFRPNTDVSAGQQPSGSCVKWHMIERQACQVSLSSGEAASIDVNGDGISSFQALVMTTGDVNGKDLMITLEVMEGDRVVTAVGVPAIQKNQSDH